MNTISVTIKKIGYLVFVLLITAFWGCGGGGSSNGSSDILGSDIIIGDSQIATDSSIQDIEDIKDIIESGDAREDIEIGLEVGSDITDTSEDISDAQGSDAIEDILTDISDVVEDIVVDGECKDECTVSACKDNYILNSCVDWNNDGCKEYKEVVCEKGCENGACKTCIPNCANKECGDDGCGGVCGSCGNYTICNNNNKCECIIGFANCNGSWVDGCEANLSTDPHHCSDCATDCGDNSLCNNKTCACQIGYANCDGLWLNGCEINLNDPNTCGTNCSNIVNCGQNSVCISGVCGCKSGYANCNNDWSDGCEVDLNSINSCGTSCSNKVVCSTNNGSNPVCDNGVCRLTCNNGYADCNAKLGSSDGCEIDLSNTNTCGISCDYLTNCGQNSLCVFGSCDCKSDYANCNNNWADGCETNLTSNNDNCGSCGNSCGPNGICSNSQCGCVSPYLNCNGLLSDGCEANKNTDVNNCGGCGNKCDLPNVSNNVCVNGVCKVGSCMSGYGNCDGVDSNGCETDLTSINSCGTSCSNKVVCSTNNGTNPICDNGVCRLTCNSGYMDCNARLGASDGCETNLNSPSTCGTHCGNIINCGANSRCDSGICGCIAGYNNCNGLLSDGCEKQLDPKHLWSKSFGGISDDGGSVYDKGSSVSIDSSGNVYITGWFLSSTIDFGGGALTNAGSYDIYLAKFDSNGNHLWSKRFGGSGYYDVGQSVSVDSSGNVYITGVFSSNTIDFGGGPITRVGGYDIFLAKFDTNGNYIWSKRFISGSYNGYQSVYVDSSDNVYITGVFRSGTIDFGGGPLSNTFNNGHSDIYIAKFDSNGNHKWSKSFGGNDDDFSNSVSVDSSGNVYITGYFYSSTIDFGGGALTNAGNYDIFLAKFDSNGNHKWSKRFGGSIDDRGYSVSVDSSGNVYITGYFYSSTIDFGGGALTNANAGYSDIFLAKFDSNGNHKWSKRFGGSSYDEGNAVFVDSSGNVNITGWFGSSTIYFGGGGELTNAGSCDQYGCPADIFLAKFDSNGNHKWSKRFGGSIDDRGYSVSVDSSGNVYGTGYFQSSNADFGVCPISSAGGSDIFLIKYAP